MNDPQVRCVADKTIWIQKEEISELSEPEQKVNKGQFCWVARGGRGISTQFLGSCEALAKALK